MQRIAFGAVLGAMLVGGAGGSEPSAELDPAAGKRTLPVEMGRG